MRETARDRERLLHIKEAIGRIKRYMDGVDVDTLRSDDMRYYAVVKNNYLYNYYKSNNYEYDKL